MHHGSYRIKSRYKNYRITSKNQNIVKAKGTGEGPLTSFFACCHLTPLGSFPLLFVSYWSHYEQKQQFIKYSSFFFLTTRKQFENLTSKNAIYFWGCLKADLNLKTVQPYWHMCPVYLSICCVKYCFHHKNIGTTIQKSSGLFCVGLYQLIKG